jgi:hypothetical protein
MPPPGWEDDRRRLLIIRERLQVPEAIYWPERMRNLTKVNSTTSLFASWSFGVGID